MILSFREIPPDRRLLVREAVDLLHRDRVRLVAPLLVLMTGLFLAADLVLVSDSPGDPQLRVYLGLDTGFLLLHLAAFAAAAAVGRNRGFPLAWAAAYVGLILAWAVPAGAIEFQRTGNFTTILLAVFGVSAAGLFPTGLFSVLILGALCSYGAVTLFWPGFRAPGLEESQSLLALVFLAFGVSRVLHSAVVRNILATAELREARLNLIRQEKLASLGVLAAGIAHEVNNPLAFIKSNVATLERNQGELHGDPAVLKENRQIFEETREGFRRISDVVQALGSFGRDAPDSVPVPYDLNQGVRTTVALSRHETKDGISLDLDLEEVPSVMARGSEINQVILNLLLNAFQAVRLDTGPGSRQVGVRTRREGASVTLEVWNNGPPVPPELAERIFEPFFSTKEPGAGMGLGLSLAWEIVVRRHGGVLELKAGEPVTFRLELPLSASAGA